MTTRIFILQILILALAFASCNKATPAGFWKSYRKDLQVKEISDQGPNGGHRAIYWESDRANTFISSEVLDFARKSSWTLMDSSVFSGEETSKWTYENQAVFPLTNTGFSDTQLNDAHLIDFPRWFGGQLTVYKFKTGWVTVEPSTDSSIEENGFVVFNSNGTQMAVYHLWGE